MSVREYVRNADGQVEFYCDLCKSLIDIAGRVAVERLSFERRTGLISRADAKEVGP